MRKALLFAVISASCLSKALPLDFILKADDAMSLKARAQSARERDFLESLCARQKSYKTPPSACYKLALPADSWCLALKIEDLKLETLEEALKSPFLSLNCRLWLEEKRKILFYRKKDFLLPELKNYWTGEKAFF